MEPSGFKDVQLTPGTQNNSDIVRNLNQRSEFLIFSSEILRSKPLIEKNFFTLLNHCDRTLECTVHGHEGSERVEREKE